MNARRDNVGRPPDRLPPQDLAAEAAVLSAILLEPDALDRVVAVLLPQHFYSEANRLIFEAALDVSRKGSPIDVVTVAGSLRNRGRLAQIGGAKYLAEIADAVPAVAHLPTYARMVEEKWRIRAFILTCQQFAAEAYSDVGEARALIERARQAVEELGRTPADVHTWETPGARAARLGVRGVQMPTGFETLDQATRGGPRAGRVVVIGGPPGVGKTGFSVDIAIGLARKGYNVAIYAADEEADGLLIRIGQSLGFAREDLENGELATLRAFSDRLRDDLPALMLVDADEDDATIEEVGDELLRRSNGAPCVLVVDSIQTTRAAGGAEAKAPRERVDGVLAALKRIAKRGALVLATSELARGAYRSRKPEEQIDPLAAFKESGGIEYGVALALVLSGVRGEDDLVDVVIAKNRMGRKLPFRLKINFTRAKFVEVPLPESVSGEPTAAARFEMNCEKVFAFIESTPGVAGNERIAEMMHIRPATVREAVGALSERGRVIDRGTGSPKRPRLYAVAAGDVVIGTGGSSSGARSTNPSPLKGTGRADGLVGMPSPDGCGTAPDGSAGGAPARTGVHP